MPEISRFYGIIIRMHIDEHNPPHIHAQYGEVEAVILIDELALYSGYLPRRALRMVLQWARLHQKELYENWKNLREGIPAKKIKPLD